MPYFPYSRQSKKKSHRGAITARMIANLLHVAGVNHVITIDLHASQMQGFFKCPVDNLVAEPLIARWIRMNVPNWREAVVVSKNPGGTKRVTSLADALKLSFGIVTTDRRRFRTSGLHSMNASVIYERLAMDGTYDTAGLVEPDLDAAVAITPLEPPVSEPPVSNPATEPSNPPTEPSKSRPRTRASSKASSNPYARRLVNSVPETPSSPLARSIRIGPISDSPPTMTAQSDKPSTTVNSELGETGEGDGDEYTDEVCQFSPECFAGTN